MKVLVIVHGFPGPAEAGPHLRSAQGGSEIYAHAQARALVEHHGDDVVVLTSEQDSSRAEYDVRTEQRNGLRVVSINNTFRQTRSFEETYRSGVIGVIAERLMDDVKPDVAHIHHLTRLSTTIVRSLKERRIPSFMTLHDYWLLCHRGQLLDTGCRVCEGPAENDQTDCGACLGWTAGAGAVAFTGAGAMRALERRLPAAVSGPLRRVMEPLASLAARDGAGAAQSRQRLAHMREVCDDVTHFFAPSRHMRDRFVRFGVAPDRITVSGYGFEHGACQDAGRDEGERLRIGFLGSLMISKGPDLLLRAVAQLPRGSASVEIYGAHADYHGDASYRHRLEPLLNDDAVHVHGPIPHEQIAQALGTLDVLVVPSIWPENSPLVIHEAFLAGVPVIASHIGGIPEIVDHGRNGLLFRAGDVDDLTRALERLVREKELLPALRAGIPGIRTIEDDVRSTRRVYEAHVAHAPHRHLSAVVLNHRTPDETFLAVTSLLASRRPLDDVIVVDNDGDAHGGVPDALHRVWPRIRYLRTGGNIGFSGGMNAGIREALARGADRVLLMNSDVIAPPDCVERLDRCLESHASAGIAGPVVMARSEPDLISSLGMSYSPATGRMRHRGFGARAGSDDQPPARIVDGVSGCLMMVKREVFETAGLLDEAYFFSFEDLDFCLRARRAGFTTVLAGGAVAYHEGGGSLDATSPRRLYFAARNHLRLARQVAGPTGLASMWRGASIVALNLAHAVRWRGGSLPVRLWAVARGARDYMSGRFGSDR